MRPDPAVEPSVPSRVDPSQQGRVRAAVSVALAVSIGMLPVFIVGGLTPLMDFPLGEAQIGLIVGTFFLTSATGSLVAGRRAGLGSAGTLRRGIMILGLLAILAAVFVNSWWHLLVWSITSGFVNGLLQPAANLLLLARFDRGRLGGAIGIKQAAVPFASVTVGLAIPLIGLTLGWRMALTLIPALVIVTLLIAPRTSRNSDPSTARPPAPVASEADTTRALLLLAFGGGLGAGSGLSATSFFIVTALERGIEKGDAGLLLAATSLANVTTLIAAGLIADRWPKVISTRVIAAMLAVGSVGYAIVATSQGIVGLGIGAAIATGLGWGWHSLFHLNVTSGAFGRVGRATGITMTFIFGGGLVLPVAYGALAGRAGNSVGWLFLSGCVALASVLFLLSGRSASISSSSEAPQN